MPITAKRRKARKEAEATLARLQDLAKEQADRLGPYADQARDQAAIKLLQARGWTAPGWRPRRSVSRTRWRPGWPNS